MLGFVVFYMGTLHCAARVHGHSTVDCDCNSERSGGVRQSTGTGVLACALTLCVHHVLDSWLKVRHSGSEMPTGSASETVRYETMRVITNKAV